MTIFITTTIINNPIVQRSEKIQYSFDYLLMFSSGYRRGIVGIRAVDFLVSNKGPFNRLERYKNKGNYIRIDTDFIFTTIKINLDVNYRQFKETSFAAQMNAASCIGGQDKRIIITITSVYKYIGPKINHLHK